MRMSIAKVHYPVTTLGPGRRLGFWVQGCSIGCRGCLSRDTWEPRPDQEIEVADLLDACRRLCPDGADGVTISGGEPFEQPQALTGLLRGLRAWGQELARPLDILCYSGLERRTLEQDHAAILELLDALIPEPFDAGAGPGGRWRGSGNQPLVLLSDLARERYEAADSRPGASMQVVVDGDAVWMVGVPRPGDLPHVERELRARGVVMREVSWRP